MIGCQADPSIPRQNVPEKNGAEFTFPLGVYPVEPMTPTSGYSLHFEPADGGDGGGGGGGGGGEDGMPDDSGLGGGSGGGGGPEDAGGEWEEWPDRYVFDVVLPANRTQALCRQLFALFPGRVYPILDILGQDAFREIDPYISYELVGVERFSDAIRRYRDFFFEDGMVGFGAMAEEPFFYAFVDEHKIVTIRAEPSFKERIEKLLKSFGLEQMEEPAGADAAAHEHRGVLLVPTDNPGLLSPGEIVEHLKEEWQLLLNVDPDRNIDDDGKDLGTTAWRCVVRCEYGDKAPRYCEAILYADCLRQAEEVAFEAAEKLSEREKSAWEDAVIVSADRLTPTQVASLPLDSGEAAGLILEGKTAGGGGGGGGGGKKRGGAGKAKPGVVRSIRWLE